MATAAGLSERTFSRLIHRLDWDDVKIGTADRFLEGCGIDVFHFKRHSEYIRQALKRREPFAHLTPQDRKTFNRLAARWIMLQNEERQSRHQPEPA